MLTEGQKDYLNKLTPERAGEIINISPYNPKTEIISNKVTDRIRQIIPEADIRYMGASALKISGQNDVDIYIICPALLKENYLLKLTPELGQWVKNKWQWHEDEIEVSVYLSDPEDIKFREQLETFKIFKDDPRILKEYEILKESMSGQIYKEYQTAKYEFYNHILRY